MRHSFISKTMSAAMAASVAMGVIAMSGVAAFAAGGVKINETNFPDKTFRTYVSKHFDKNGDKTLSSDEITKAKTVDLSREFQYMQNDKPVYDKDEVKSLKGVEYLTELETLKFATNGVTSLDVSKNTKLVSLNCNYNRLSNLDLSQNTNLEYLHCSYCNLTSLDVSKNTKLCGLDASYNVDWDTADSSKRTAKDGLKKLDLSHNKKLIDIDVSDNFLLKTLKLTNLDKIIALDIDYTKITKVDFSKMKSLQICNISGTGFTDFVPSEHPELTGLFLAELGLSKIDLSKNPKLEYLSVKDNKLKSLDVSKNEALLSLEADNNLLTSLDLSKNSKLKSLYASNNKINYINVRHNPDLEFLFCYQNDLKSLDVSKNKNLNVLFCYMNKLTKLDLSKNAELTLLDCGGNKIEVLDVSGCPKLDTLGAKDMENLKRIIVPLGIKYSDFYLSYTDSSLNQKIFYIKPDYSRNATAKKPGNATVKYVIVNDATGERTEKELTVTVCYKDVTNQKDFWFDPTYYLTTNNVVKGYDKQTNFKPDNDCTRAQMVTFLWRLAGSPAPKSGKTDFTDIKSSDYFYKAVLWAVEQGITTGVSKTKFDPQAVCTRAQTVTFLWRMAGKIEPASKTNPFNDVSEKDYFYKAVLWASEKKIVAGYSDGSFKPADKCLRRQMVTFLYKYDKYINGKG